VSTVEIEVFGIEGVKLVVRELPQIPVKAVEAIIKGVRDSGVKVAQATLREGASPLSSGETARRMQGIIMKSEEAEEWLLRIGPDMDGVPMHTPKTAASMQGHREYPYWVSAGGMAGTGPVQIGPPAVRWGYSKNPMDWVTIDRAIRIAPHPWMQEVADTIEKEFGESFGRKLSEETRKLKSEADRVSLRGFFE
jgi:hypothetical protein